MKTTAVIDVNAFFEHLIEAYTDFGEEAVWLSTHIPTLSLPGIKQRCHKLNQHRQELACLDEQLFEILELIGHEPSLAKQLQRYRLAFSSASVAIDNIHSQLQTVRNDLEVVAAL